MEFAIVDGQRTPAQPALIGVCEYCGRRMTAKCGRQIIWHWAHAGKKYCDPWWENETAWHREWKSYFPENLREQRRFDHEGNEWHIADVLSRDGVVIEIQNSPMPLDELQSRENFYKKMIWIVNGEKFSSSFHILGRLPAPHEEWVKDLVFYPQRRNLAGHLFYRHSENPSVEQHEGEMVLVHGMHEIQSQIDEAYIGHHFYDWVKPHSVWFASTMPIYLDFGDDYLWLLTLYGNSDLYCAKIVSKSSIVSQFGGIYIPKGFMRRMPGRRLGNGAPIDRGECNVIPHLIPV